jgi:hypothetical protein
VKPTITKVGIPKRIDAPIRELTPLQVIVCRLFWVVLAVIVFVVLALVTDWLLRSPRAPVLCGTSEQQQAAVLSTYSRLSEVVLNHDLMFFRVVVLQGLLPIATALLGFLLWNRRLDIPRTRYEEER